MENKEPNLDVQSEDWERQPSEPTDLGTDYRVDRVRVHERIKAIHDQLSRHDERMTRIEAGIGAVKNDLEKDIETVKKDLNDRISRLETRLQLRVTLIFAGVSIFVSILVVVVPLIFKIVFPTVSG